MARKRKISGQLSTNGIAHIERQLQSYSQFLLTKCERFINALADEGIIVAQANIGGRTSITFSKDVTVTTTGATGKMSGYSPLKTVTWAYFGTTKSAEISPILMAEFGAGQFASDASGKPNAQYAAVVGAGRGTFPGQTHANDDRWYWRYSEGGKWHSSAGTTPTMPMYYAAVEMRKKIYEIGRRIFGP